QLRQHLECGPRELGPEDEGLEARDDRVAAEDRHEPGDTGARQPADARVVGLHAQRGEIRDRLAERVGERVPRCAELRDAQLPGSERIANPAHLFAEAPLREAWGNQLAVGTVDDIDSELTSHALLVR